MVSPDIMTSLKIHPIIRFLFLKLPPEIVHMIAIKFRGITPFSTSISQQQLTLLEKKWHRKFIQKTIISIYVYRKNNIFTNDPFLFPRIEPPNINKTPRICEIRNVKVKYQLFSRQIPFCPFNIPFHLLNRKIMIHLFRNLCHNNKYLMKKIESLEYRNKEIKRKIVRIYYRFNEADFRKNKNKDEYLENISRPWINTN